MGKHRIEVGREYERAFASVCDIVTGGYLGDGGITVSGQGDRREIDDGTYVYVLGEGGRRSAQDEIAFREDGASWFSSLRGKDQPNTNATWIAFMETVANSYHRRYSLVEYLRKQDEEETAEQNKLLDGYIKNILGVFFPALTGYETRLCEESAEDIYGLSMRLELSGGTGAAVPVLGKVYFCKRNTKLLPLRRAEGKGVSDYLDKIVSKDADRAEPSKTDEGIVNTALVALEKLISGKIGGYDFTACFCPGGETDSKAIETLCRQIARDETVTLECSAVKVLGVSRIKWNSLGKDVIFRGKPVLRFSVAFGGAVSLSCLNCREDEGLIENNHVRYRVGEEEKTVSIDPSKTDLGLTEKELGEIREDGLFSRHIMFLSCNENLRNPACKRILCASCTETFTDNDKQIVKCRDCPYPEIVYTDMNGKALYTPLLAFASDKKELVPESTLVQCTCCGRSYTEESMGRSSTCSFCLRAAEGGGKKERELYRRYAQMLSPFIRLKYFGKKKYCYEDEEKILFVLGETKYLFDKLDVGSEGYLPRPVKEREV